MSVPFRLWMLVSALFISLQAVAQTSVAELPFLEISSYGNPELVLAYRTKLIESGKARRNLGESGYQHALMHSQRKNVSWGAVKKGVAESMSLYPESKILFLGVQAYLQEARELDERHSNRNLVPTRLEKVVGWLDSVIALEKVEPSLDASDRDKPSIYRDCLNDYQKTKIADTSCVPLRWAGIISN